MIYNGFGGLLQSYNCKEWFRNIEPLGFYSENDWIGGTLVRLSNGIQLLFDETVSYHRLRFNECVDNDTDSSDLDVSYFPNITGEFLLRRAVGLIRLKKRYLGNEYRACMSGKI